MTTDLRPWWETETVLDRKAVKDALWQAILARLEDIKQANPSRRGFSRDQAHYSVDGMSCVTQAEMGQDDGTKNVYYLTARYAGNHWCAFNGDKISVEVRPSFHSSEWFWEPIITLAGASRLNAVVEGVNCYTVEPDSDKPGPGDGFSGARFTIAWLDDDGQPTGEITVTRNMWSRGTIPPKFRDVLKPNATITRD